MLLVNLFTLDILFLMPGFFFLLILLILVLYSVLVSSISFSRFLVEDIILKVSFSLFLGCLLLLNQVSVQWKSFNFYFS